MGGYHQTSRNNSRHNGRLHGAYISNRTSLSSSRFRLDDSTRPDTDPLEAQGLCVIILLARFPIITHNHGKITDINSVVQTPRPIRCIALRLAIASS